MVTALLHCASFKDHRDLQRRIYDEWEIRTLLCDDCPSLLLGGGLIQRRWHVVHEATCPTWIRYQKKLPGYTLQNGCHPPRPLPQPCRPGCTQGICRADVIEQHVDRWRRRPLSRLQKKCHETEIQLGVAARETTEEPQVKEDQHVTGNEILQYYYSVCC